MQTQLSNQAQVAFDEVGQGAPVVWLHAFPLSRQMWQPQLAALQGAGQMLAVDLRGFGGTSLFAGPPTVDQMADDVALLISNRCGPQPVVLAGLSMGGYVALAFARRHPRRLRGLILADTRAEPDSEEAKANRDKLIAFAEQHTPADVVESMLEKLLGATTRAQRPAVAALVRELAATQRRQGVIDALRMLRDRPDSRPSLAEIPVPTLVIVGSEDLLTPVAAAETLASGIPGARLVQIAQAGHLSNLEQPELFNAAVLEFLQQLAE